VIIRSASISPSPTDEETAAITAAVEAMWPRPVFTAEEVQRREAAWRFSGRWWTKPLPTRRDRPYR
jgi:hypothetical protein